MYATNYRVIIAILFKYLNSLGFCALNKNISKLFKKLQFSSHFFEFSNIFSFNV